MSDRGRAGHSAQKKYDDLVSSWRRRNRRFFTIVGVVCGGLIAASLVIVMVLATDADSGERRGVLVAWLAGLVTGSSIAFFMTLWLSPPGWIENWQTGAQGERATGKALAGLDAARWTVLHDVATERGNIDHIVIGPGGVFVIDSKRPGGSVVVEGTTVRISRLDDPDQTYEFPRRPAVCNQAAQTSSRVASVTRIKQWITPVVVVWADFPQRVVDADFVVVHGDELVGWLQNHEVTIAPVNVSRIAAAVEAAWRS